MKKIVTAENIFTNQKLSGKFNSTFPPLSCLEKILLKHKVLNREDYVDFYEDLHQYAYVTYKITEELIEE